MSTTAPGASNEPYRHLEDREEILWGLHFRQLVYVLLGAVVGIVFGLYVSPLPAGPSLMVAIIVAGLPVVLSLVASNGELAPWTVTYALWRWWRSPKLYIPGANPASPATTSQKPTKSSSFVRARVTELQRSRNSRSCCEHHPGNAKRGAGGG